MPPCPRASTRTTVPTHHKESHFSTTTRILYEDYTGQMYCTSHGKPCTCLLRGPLSHRITRAHPARARCPRHPPSRQRQGKQGRTSRRRRPLERRTSTRGGTNAGTSCRRTGPTAAPLTVTVVTAAAGWAAPPTRRCRRRPGSAPSGPGRGPAALVAAPAAGRCRSSRRRRLPPDAAKRPPDVLRWERDAA